MKQLILLLCLSALSLTAQAQLEMKFDSDVEGNNVHLVWAVGNQNGIERYIIERSTDGREWDLVTNVMVTGGDWHIYQHLDTGLPDGIYTYRITLVYDNGLYVIPGYNIVYINRGPTIGPASGFPDLILFNEI